VVATLFKGETLRGLLLNSYGWSQIAQYGFFAGIGLAIAAFAVLMAFAYEVFAWRRSVRTAVTKPTTAAPRVSPQHA
jgi:hypothetical protein